MREDFSVSIYVSLSFKVKLGYTQGLLKPKARKPINSSEQKHIADKDDEVLQKVEIIYVDLAQCHWVDNDNQHDLKVLLIFVTNWSFGHVLKILRSIFLHL